jgi:AcrR family transcriptional regulator
MATNPRVPHQQRAIETKDKILEVAIRCFSELGYHGANTKVIAHAAGVSIGSLYSYYPDKQTILIEAARYYFERFGEIVDSRSELISKYFMDRRAIVTGAIQSLLEAHEGCEVFHDMIHGLAPSMPGIRALVDEHEARIVERVRATLATAGPRKDPSALEASSVVLAAAIQGAVDRIAKEDGERREMVESLVELVCRFAFG